MPYTYVSLIRFEHIRFNAVNESFFFFLQLFYEITLFCFSSLRKITENHSLD